MKKTLLLRPGALGDVLAARTVIGLLKKADPDTLVGLAAPGERGRFLCRPGLADMYFDWERRDIAWLFSTENVTPSEKLAAFFSSADVIIVYMESSAADALTKRLRRIAAGAEIIFWPPAPPSGSAVPIGSWLAQAAYSFLERKKTSAEITGWLEQVRAEKIVMPASQAKRDGAIPRGRYVVMHPGSGSKKKNWPVSRFAELGHELQSLKDRSGRHCFDAVVVTSGEADGDVGEVLARNLPGVRHYDSPDLELLATLLAGASVYIGNDSGVSHLAAGVRDEDGNTPEMVLIFGPSESRIWASSGAQVLEAGNDMARIEVDAVLAAVRKIL